MVATIDCGGSLNALSCSPDGSLVVVGGREVFKIISIEKGELSEKQNLRVGRSVNLNFSAVDAKWHPVETFKNLIATAATNGAVIVWNLLRQGSKQEQVFTEHSRTVNRVCWRPADANILLSGSQDGTIKLWDIREGACKHTFNCKSESVRDLSFSPFYQNYFAAGFDSGFIQVWDVRKPTTFERQISAHNGLVLSVDWHPEEKSIVASAGRDRIVKVWDLNETDRPKHSIQTIASVARVQWRPEHKSQITSAAHNSDPQIHVWDLQRPYIPQYSFRSHRDAVTAFQWHKGQPDSLLSCAKDSLLCLQHVPDAFHPYEHIPTVSVSWTPRNELAVVTDTFDRHATPSAAGASALFQRSTASVTTPVSSASAAASAAPTGGFLRTVSSYFDIDFPEEKGIVRECVVKSQIKEFGQTLGFEPKSFELLAKTYKYRGGSISELCAHNGKVAREAGQVQIERVWSMIEIMYGEVWPEMSECFGDFVAPPPPPPPFVDTDIMDNDQQQSESQSNSQQLQDDAYDGISFTKDVKILSPSVSPLHTNPPSSHLFDAMSSSLLQPTPCFAPPVFYSAANFTTTMPAASCCCGPCEEMAPPKLDDDQNNKTLVKYVEKDVEEQQNLKIGYQVGNVALPPFSINMEEMLEFHAEMGDVQTCVAVVLVLKDRLKVDTLRGQQWFIGYIDLLRELQLWTCASEIIRLCPYEQIAQMNQKGTTIYTTCSQCQKAQLEMGNICPNCKKVSSHCTVCRMPVKGIFVWCQGCGHGGHLAHMRSWFSQHSTCPVCNHVCSLKCS